MTHHCSEWLLFLASHGITYSCVHPPPPPVLLLPRLRETQPGWEVESACVDPTKPRTGAARLPGPPPPSTPTWMLPGRRPCWPSSWQCKGQGHHQLLPIPPSPSCRAVNLQNEEQALVLEGRAKRPKQKENWIRRSRKGGTTFQNHISQNKQDGAPAAWCHLLASPWAGYRW